MMCLDTFMVVLLQIEAQEDESRCIFQVLDFIQNCAA